MEESGGSVPAIVLNSFLFGNINQLGQLECDILDSESKKHLGSLSRLGFNSFLDDFIDGSERSDSDSDDDNVVFQDREDGKNLQNINPECHSEEDRSFDIKSPSAIDYSDIDEVCDDDTLDFKNHDRVIGETDDNYDADDELAPIKSDEQLMPPPPLPSSKREESCDTVTQQAAQEKKLNTPMAAMLPSKYANVDVTELFPEFRVNKVLRFLRLFGPAKKSSLPQMWGSSRKRRKRRRQQRHDRSDSDSEQENDGGKRGRWQMSYGPSPPPDLWDSNDEEKLLQPADDKAQGAKSQLAEDSDNGPKVADWRYGPAQVWYDMLKVPETGEGFNYGFKARNDDSNPKDSEEQMGEDFAEDAYLMVSQLHWENDVIWDGDAIKDKVLQKLKCKSKAAGWLPSCESRTAQTLSLPAKGILHVAGGTVHVSNAQMSCPNFANNMANKAQVLVPKRKQPCEENPDDTCYSIFPVENEELIYGLWEDEVIWDSENMDKIPKPKVLALDPNDENIVLGIPDDTDPAKQQLDSGARTKVKILHPHVKKSKLLLGKAGVINVMEEDAPPSPPKSPDRDPFNVSNDKYYMPKTSESALRLKVGGGNLIQHSTPVVELQAPFVPTHMGPVRLRNFHRPPLKRFSHGVLARPGHHHVLPLLKHIEIMAKQREHERAASGGGDVFFMRTPEDLTGRDGDLVLVEFCEEHPPLMNLVGMCSKMKNYFKRRAGKDQGPQEFRYGEIAYAHTSPFLGKMPHGHSMQALENNLYRAPIYEHRIPETDFLIVRTRQHYFIREIDALYVAGQECPLYEVPGPNSKRANNFVRDFLQVFIYRLFWKSNDIPRKIRMEDIKKAFPSHSETCIRKRLKLCADFKRTGMDSNSWVLKSNFRLPPEEEIRDMVSPEQCCAYFSMIAAEQRLKDAGYGEKFLFAPQEEDDEEMQLRMDDEVKVAPWNTTRAYIQAIKGKCLLQLMGPADPTGCGEGFSYIQVPNKPIQSKEEQEAQQKRIVTGTDADLRRLSLTNAKALLRKFGVPEEEIRKLSRWEVIDVVRTLSTEKAKAGEEGMTKFSRGNRFSIAEHQERYKEECQRIFDLQNHVLSSNEVLSTDEAESSDDDSSDIEEMGKNIENMLYSKKTSTQLTLEKEEQERQELRKMLMGERSEQDQQKVKVEKKDGENNKSLPGDTSPSAKVLKIYRTFRDADGREYKRVELVRKPEVIEAYIKIRTTKDDAFVRQFATLDDHQKEEMKREKRRILEQLRRIKRNQKRGRLIANKSGSPSIGKNIDCSLSTSFFQQSPMSAAHQNIHSSQISAPKRKKVKVKPDLKLKCGACGNVGHMRTNKACPLYQPSAPNPPLNVAMTEEQEEEIERQLNTDDEDLVNVDGTKVKLSGKLLKHAEEIKRRTLLLKVPKGAVRAQKRRRTIPDMQCDYLKRQQRSIYRRRTDPLVELSTILESILTEMRDMPDVQPFLFPVNAKVAPDYHKIVTRPMDLRTIRENLNLRKYQCREEFLNDVNQIVENSTLYNGARSCLTIAAKQMLDLCGARLAVEEERLIVLEKAINPLLDDDDQVALTFILDSILNNKLKRMPESWHFLKPVNKKLFKDYYTIVKYPMDLETVSQKIAAQKYQNHYEFMADIDQILQNCILFNGKDSRVTQNAKELVRVCSLSLEGYGEHLNQLEKNIKLVKKRALEQAWRGVDEMNYTIAESDSQESKNEVALLDHSNTSISSSPGHPFGKTSSLDFEFVDVEGDADSLSLQKIKKGVLEEDLQVSSEEDVSVGEMMPDDDSQQAAEAMMQLGNMCYYPQSSQVLREAEGENPELEENMDVGHAYDASDILISGFPEQRAENEARNKPNIIAEDLEVSDSEDEFGTSVAGFAAASCTIAPQSSKEKTEEEEQDGGLWF